MSAGRGSGWVRASVCGPRLDCVELRCAEGDRVQVRDSKDPAGRVLALPWRALSALVAGVGPGGALGGDGLTGGGLGVDSLDGDGFGVGGLDGGGLGGRALSGVGVGGD
jgi:hypothetical protein